jgi:hypothetical protein
LTDELLQRQFSCVERWDAKALSASRLAVKFPHGSPGLLRSLGKRTILLFAEQNGAATTARP